jgi:hypothetical protein
MSSSTVQDAFLAGSSRSALFVDFDNVYLGLWHQEPDLAVRFAEQPGRWIEWLQRALEVPAESWLAPARRILVRRCYLNPQSFGKWRAYFIRAGFETIDCPPLTAQGKTSADVHMVLDIIDFLAGPTVFDEFIIMSADADFAPVLLKLRKHDRRSIVVAIGPSSSAYTAASDLVIDQDTFLDFLLSDAPLRASAAPAAPPVEPVPQPLQVVAESSSESFTAHRDQLCSIVRDVVARSPVAVPLASVAHAIRARYPHIALDWGHHDSFSAMLDELDLANLTRVSRNPGYIYDPTRHAAPLFETPKSASEKFEELHDTESQPRPTANADAHEWEDGALRGVARRVSDLTDIPDLPPATYAELFSILAAEVNANGYQVNQVSRAVRDECQRRGRHISRHVVNFIMQGIAFAGHRLGTTTEVEKELARAFFRNALNLCARNQLYLTDDEQQLVAKWLTGQEADSPTIMRPDDRANDE